MLDVEMPNQQKIGREVLSQDGSDPGHRLANLEMLANFPPHC
jgi:hypothetical protein